LLFVNVVIVDDADIVVVNVGMGFQFQALSWF
jgi:hypothetical protein